MDELKYLIGSKNVLDEICNNKNTVFPISIYSEVVCMFLDTLSKQIRKDAEAKLYSDVMSFGFWCRKSNIAKQNLNIKETRIRMGRGMVFHIAPSNVPVNFAFSLVFGLLSGNSNVVRVSDKYYPQVNILCRNINEVLRQAEFELIRSMICVLQYEKESKWNEYFSKHCMGRIIWGGDSTIKRFEEFSIPPRAVEIHFADRYSLAVLSPQAVLEATKEEKERLAHNFYNDTYLMDQNACSSPHLICWLKGGMQELELQKAIEEFWDVVEKQAASYTMEEIKALDKYTMACELSMECDEISNWEQRTNILYTMRLRSLPHNLEKFRGLYGMFFEYVLEDFGELANELTEKTQTCLYYGIDPTIILDGIQRNHIRGIDRIVPVGKSLDISTVWDGYDIVKTLSRVILME